MVGLLSENFVQAELVEAPTLDMSYSLIRHGYANDTLRTHGHHSHFESDSMNSDLVLEDLSLCVDTSLTHSLPPGWLSIAIPCEESLF